MKLPLKLKAILMIVLVGFLIANTAVIVYDRGITELTNREYEARSTDIAIKSLSGLICKIFKHLPVFRIVGDEFVIILTNEDLDAREGLIGQFRDASGFNFNIAVA